MSNAGRAIVTIGADNNPLAAGLSQAQRMLSGFAAQAAKIGASFAAVGAAVAAPIAKGLQEYASLDRFSKLADKTGAAVEDLSALAYAAQQSAVPFDQLANALTRMQANAAKGGLGALGESIKSMGAAQGLQQVADYMAQLPSDAERAAAAMQVFGRGGAVLLPLLKPGNLAPLLAEAQRVGQVFSAEDARNATALGDSWSKLKSALQGVEVALGAIFAQDVTDLANDLAEASAGVRDFVSQNKDAIVVVAKVAAGLAAAGGAMLGIAAAAKAAAVACGVLAASSSLLVGVAAPVAILAAGFAGVALAAYECSQAVRDFVASAPGEALGAIGEAAQYARDAWATVTDWLSQRLGAIWRALASGDSATAIQIAALSLQEAFWSAIDAVYDKWVDTRYALASVALDIVDALASVWDSLKVYGMEVAREFVKTFDFIGSAIVEAIIGPLESAYDAIRGEGSFAQDIGLSAKGGLSDQTTPWLDAQIAAQQKLNAAAEEERATRRAAMQEGLEAAKREERDSGLQAIRDRMAAIREQYDATVAALPEPPALAEARRGAAAAGEYAAPKTGTAGVGVVGSRAALAALGGNAADRTAENTGKLVKAAQKQEQLLQDIADATEADDGSITLS